MGAATTNGCCQDAWVWTGTNLRPVALSGAPDFWTEGGLAFDPVRKQMVLFGGANPFTPTVSAETWLLY